MSLPPSPPVQEVELRPCAPPPSPLDVGGLRLALEDQRLERGERQRGSGGAQPTPRCVGDHVRVTSGRSRGHHAPPTGCDEKSVLHLCGLPPPNP